MESGPIESGARPFPTALRPGVVIGGKLVLLRQIGQGAAGAIFEAEDTWLGRRVALKVLHPHVALYPEVMWRFRREARAAASIDHPNIVAVLEVGQRRDGTYYIVQELLEGKSLRSHLQERARLSVLDALEILVPIMGALVAAHRKDIVHRDIKPENILLAVGASGEVTPKLIDFGIARMQSHEGEQDTASGVLLGTPSYMSPEQAQGGPVDATTDIWAVGAVLYELVSGTRPFTAASAALVVEKIRTETPVLVTTHLPSLPEPIVEVVHQALERDPLRRFASMQAFLRAVLDYAAGQDPSFISRHARSLPRHLGAPPEEWPRLDPEADEDARSSVAPPFVPLRPLVRPDLEWHEERAEPAFRSLDAQAETALRVNALDDAIVLAERALQDRTVTTRPHLLGRMRLVQAVANRWLGHYVETERCAREARADLPHGNAGWYVATAHLATAAGYLGKNDVVEAIAEELAAMAPTPASRAAYVKTICQVVVFTIRAGGVALADRLVGIARATSFELPYGDPSVHAWLDQASSELAMHAGDPTTFLRLVESAVEGFAEAGDARNAALQRANIGIAYMQLGAFGRATRVLRQAIAVAEPMKLSFIAPVKANLGRALGFLGELDEAVVVERDAVEGCVAQGYRRFEAASRVFLAEILSLRGEREAAEAEVQRALAVASSAPATHAHALATAAHLLLAREEAARALDHATEAMRLLTSAVGVEEGEAWIRLVHARALAAAGQHEEAARYARLAQDRLAERAARIGDVRYRRSFLRDVPENAATAALSASAPAR